MLGRALVLVFLCVLGGCATLPSHSLWRRVVVTSVTGLHEGKCGPGRVQQVTRVLESLTARDFYDWHRLCPCIPQSVFEMAVNIRRLEVQNARHSMYGVLENMDVIDLGKPIRYPVPWGDKREIAAHPRFVRQLIVEKSPSSMGPGYTIFFFGLKQVPPFTGTRAKIIFEGWGLKDDPFDLGRGERGRIEGLAT